MATSKEHFVQSKKRNMKFVLQLAKSLARPFYDFPTHVAERQGF